MAEAAPSAAAVLGIPIMIWMTVVPMLGTFLWTRQKKDKIGSDDEDEGLRKPMRPDQYRAWKKASAQREKADHRDPLTKFNDKVDENVNHKLIEKRHQYRNKILVSRSEVDADAEGGYEPSTDEIVRAFYNDVKTDLPTHLSESDLNSNDTEILSFGHGIKGLLHKSGNLALYLENFNNDDEDDSNEEVTNPIDTDAIESLLIHSISEKVDKIIEEHNLEETLEAFHAEYSDDEERTSHIVRKLQEIMEDANGFDDADQDLDSLLSQFRGVLPEEYQGENDDDAVAKAVAWGQGAMKEKAGTFWKDVNDKLGFANKTTDTDNDNTLAARGELEKKDAHTTNLASAIESSFDTFLGSSKNHPVAFFQQFRNAHSEQTTDTHFIGTRSDKNESEVEENIATGKPHVKLTTSIDTGIPAIEVDGDKDIKVFKKLQHTIEPEVKKVLEQDEKVPENGASNSSNIAAVNDKKMDDIATSEPLKDTIARLQSQYHAHDARSDSVDAKIPLPKGPDNYPDAGFDPTINNIDGNDTSCTDPEDAYLRYGKDWRKEIQKNYNHSGFDACIMDVDPWYLPQMKHDLDNKVDHDNFKKNHPLWQKQHDDNDKRDVVEVEKAAGGAFAVFESDAEEVGGDVVVAHTLKERSEIPTLTSSIITPSTTATTTGINSTPNLPTHEINAMFTISRDPITITLEIALLALIGVGAGLLAFRKRKGHKKTGEKNDEEEGNEKQMV